MNNKLKCASFFAGVGGIDLGFESTDCFETVYANEIDPYPARTYNLNSNITVDCRDIREVQPDQIPNFDVCLAGFPCQSFSVAGYRQGFDDKKGRGTLFFEIARILKEKKPYGFLLENVEGLLNHDKGKTMTLILSSLKNLGYKVTYNLINAEEHGLAQSRKKVYIVGTLIKEISLEKFKKKTCNF